jgi:hypothetical protein
MADGTELKAGTVPDYGTSMARAMESALDAQLQSKGRPTLGASGAEAEYMRMMFVAIAQGVVNHLQDNPRAFETTAEVAVDGIDHRHRVDAVHRTGARIGGS